MGGKTLTRDLYGGGRREFVVACMERVPCELVVLLEIVGFSAGDAICAVAVEPVLVVLVVSEDAMRDGSSGSGGSFLIFCFSVRCSS